MKTVSLSVKNKYRKETLIRRIQEKVSAENVSTVIILTDMDHEHTAVLSGISPGIRGSASIGYSFDDKTKTVTSWKITWHNQLLQNIFLGGLFEKKG